MLSKVRTGSSGQKAGGGSYSRGALYKLLANRIYIGEIFHKGNSYPGEHKAIIDRELWESVRAKLAENHRARRHRTDTSEPSLLSGLIFDQDGSRYTPSHAVKKGKRYRYYVSQRIIHGRSPAAAPSRIPARELEQLVLTELASFFGSADRVSAILGQAGEDLETTRALVDAAQQFAKALAGDSTSGLREMLAGIVVRITIQQDSIEVHVSKEGARARLLNQERILGQDSDGQPIVLTIEMKLKRCGGEMRLIIPGWAAIDQRRQPVSSLIKAVSRASDWVRRMEGGEFKHQRAPRQGTGARAPVHKFHSARCFSGT